jgi:hypothetical protein
MMNIVETSIGCPSASTWNRAILRHIGEVQDELDNNFFPAMHVFPEDLCQGLSCVREPRRMRCLLTMSVFCPTKPYIPRPSGFFLPALSMAAALARILPTMPLLNLALGLIIASKSSTTVSILIWHLAEQLGQQAW